MDSQGKAKVALTFALYQGDSLVRRDTIVQDIVKVGKDPRSHLRVDDELASRMHAVIEVASPGDITLIDLGNEPGTLVNGQRVNKCKIRPGDQIQIGSTLIQLENAEAAAVDDGRSSAGSRGGMLGRPRAPCGSSDIAARSPRRRIAFAPAAAYRLPRANPCPPRSAVPAAASSGSPFAAPAPRSRSANPFAPPPPPAANPFVAQAVPAPAYGVGPVPMDIDPNQPFTYQMIKSGPEVNPDEVEVPHLAAIEVMVMWDTNVLHVSHLAPPRSFYVGEEQTNNVSCDYFIPSETLGTTRAPVVVARGMSAALVILPRSSGYVDLPRAGARHVSGSHPRPVARVPRASCRARTSPKPPAGAEGAQMELEGSSIVFPGGARSMPASRCRRAPSRASSRPLLLAIGLSFLLHMGIVASLAFFMPAHAGLDDSEAIDRDRSPHDAEVPRPPPPSASRRKRRRSSSPTRTPTTRKAARRTRARAKEGVDGEVRIPMTPDASSVCRGPRTTRTRTSRARRRFAKRRSSG